MINEIKLDLSPDWRLWFSSPFKLPACLRLQKLQKLLLLRLWKLLDGFYQSGRIRRKLLKMKRKRKRRRGFMTMVQMACMAQALSRNACKMLKSTSWHALRKLWKPRVS